MNPQKPLTQVPSHALLIRCAALLHVPIQNVYLTSIAKYDILGTFTNPSLFVGSRDFRITADQYYDRTTKIPFPPPNKQDMTQPAIDELFTTTARERAENDRSKRIRRWQLAGLLLVAWLILVALAWAFLSFNQLLP